MTEEEIQNVVDTTVHRIVERFHPDKVILFGSYARGQLTDDSDLDILVVMPVAGSCREMANQIDLALADRRVPMDVIVVTPEQFDRRKNIVGTIIGEAATEGRVLYERAA